MAVRTSAVPRGAVSQSDFDAMLRSEIARSMGRGGEKDTSAIRDQLARRLNAQEGRGTSSAAYRPRASQAVRSAGGRGGGGGSRAPAPSPRPGAQTLPDTNAPVPTPSPGAPASDGGSSYMSWLIPTLLGGAGAAYYLGRRGPGSTGPAPMAAPPAGPSKDAIAPNMVPTESGMVASGEALPAPGKMLALPYYPGATTSAAGDTDPIGRFLSEGEINAMDAKLQPLRDIMNTITGGDVGARYKGGVYKPGEEIAVPSPGLHGSRYGHPIIRYKP